MTVEIEKPKSGDVIVTESLGGSIRVRHTVHPESVATPPRAVGRELQCAAGGSVIAAGRGRFVRGRVSNFQRLANGPCQGDQEVKVRRSAVSFVSCQRLGLDRRTRQHLAPFEAFENLPPPNAAVRGASPLEFGRPTRAPSAQSREENSIDPLQKRVIKPGCVLSSAGT